MPPRKVLQILNFLTQLSVEPMIFLNITAVAISSILQRVGMYRVICRKIYDVSNPEIDCRRLSNVTIDGGELAEVAIQRAMATWGLAVGLSYAIPALIADMFLGAYGDKCGRKVNVLLGMVGFMVSTFSYIIVFTFPLDVPLYALIIVNVLAGFTGYVAICVIASGAYLANTVLDPELLTIRMALLAVAMNLGTIVGPLFVGVASEVITQAQGLVVSQVILAIAFFVCMILVHHVPPNEMRRRVLMLSNTETSSTKVTPESVASERFSKANPSILQLALNLLKETVRTYAKSRAGNIRAYLFVSVLVFFFYTISTGVRGSIVTLYLQKAPLSWPQSMIGYYMAAQNAVIAVGTIGGVLIFKKLLKFNDVVILMIACTSLLAEVLLMSMATRTWIVYVASVSSLFSGLVIPCTQSFLSRQVSHDETGKAFTAFGMSATAAGIMSDAIYSPIYSATLIVISGFVFLFAAFLLLIAFAGVIWLYYDMYLSRRPSDVTFGRALLRTLFARGEIMANPNRVAIAVALVDGSDLEMVSNSRF